MSQCSGLIKRKEKSAGLVLSNLKVQPHGPDLCLEMQNSLQLICNELGDVGAEIGDVCFELGAVCAMPGGILWCWTVGKGSELHFETGCCGVHDICWEMVFSSKNSPSQLSPETPSTVIPLVLQRNSSTAENQTLLTPGTESVAEPRFPGSTTAGHCPVSGKNGRPHKLKGWEWAVESVLVLMRGSWSCWR